MYQNDTFKEKNVVLKYLVLINIREISIRTNEMWLIKKM